MIVEFEIITDIYLQNKNGSKLVKKNDKIKKLFDLNNSFLEEYVDNKTGKHIAKYCLISTDGNTFKVNAPYEKLKPIFINKTKPVIGFIGKSKKYK